MLPSHLRPFNYGNATCRAQQELRKLRTTWKVCKSFYMALQAGRCPFKEIDWFNEWNDRFIRIVDHIYEVLKVYLGSNSILWSRRIPACRKFMAPLRRLETRQSQLLFGEEADFRLVNQTYIDMIDLLFKQLDDPSLTIIEGVRPRRS